MKHLLTISGTFLFLCVASFAQAEEADFAKTLDGLMPKLNAEKISDRHDAQKTLFAICLKRGTPGQEEQRVEACEALAQKLGTDMSTQARVWLLKPLEYIGREECVEAITPLLSDKESLVRDAARRALANNPAEAAEKVLVATMQKSKDSKFRAALIHSLGFRANNSSIAPLSAELTNKNEQVAIAAARALGKIATPESAKALLAARGKATGELKSWMGDSCLLCADQLQKEGKSAEAIDIYKQISLSKENKALRVAALRGLFKAKQNSGK